MQAEATLGKGTSAWSHYAADGMTAFVGEKYSSSLLRATGHNLSETRIIAAFRRTRQL
jgi:hypothetical protein